MKDQDAIKKGMKTVFINAKSNEEVTLPEEAVKKLKNKKTGLISNIQHLHKLTEVKKQLPNAVIIGQILGCRAENAAAKKEQLDCFLYIGTGAFHPIKVALETEKPVFVYSPATKEFKELDYEFVEKYKKQKKGSLLRFYHAKNVGILISTKIGQNMNKIASPNQKMKPIEYFKKRNDGKKYYVFAFDTLNHKELENFPFIQCWVNTGCSRIADDENAKIVNIEDIMNATQA